MKHIAIIGAGISGLASAYFLSRAHRVSVFEKEPRLGGHTHTVVVDTPAGPLPLDTGFLVHNVRTYPQLIRLFRELDIRTVETDMSFSVRCPSSGFEYSSRGLSGFYARPSQLASLAHHRLLLEIIRFNREAIAVLDDAAAPATVGAFVAQRRFSAAFVTRYLAPMASAIWSSSVEGIEAFPLPMLARFMHNHGMLSVGAHPAWRVVRGGSHTYIPRLLDGVGDSVHTGVNLLSVHRSGAGVTLRFADRPDVEVDDVVFACHGDQVLPLLADATDTERDVFSQFSSTANETWLHTDTRFLPRVSRARAAWNYQISTDHDAAPCVTYDLNRLQGITAPVTYCVTLNPTSPIAADRVIGRYSYRHPRFTVGAVAAQQRWREVSGARHTHYCGAYWRYGFHEDGLMSAVRVAADLGVAW